MAFPWKSVPGFFRRAAPRGNVLHKKFPATEQKTLPQVRLEGTPETIWALQVPLFQSFREFSAGKLVKQGFALRLWAFQVRLEATSETIWTFQVRLEGTFETVWTHQVPLFQSFREFSAGKLVKQGFALRLWTHQVRLEGTPETVWTHQVPLEGTPEIV